MKKHLAFAVLVAFFCTNSLITPAFAAKKKKKKTPKPPPKTAPVKPVASAPDKPGTEKPAPAKSASSAADKPSDVKPAEAGKPAVLDAGAKALPLGKTAEVEGLGTVQLVEESYGGTTSTYQRIMNKTGPKGKENVLYATTPGYLIAGIGAMEGGKYVFFPLTTTSAPEFTDLLMLDPTKPFEENIIWRAANLKNATFELKDVDKDGQPEVCINYTFLYEGMPGSFFKYVVYKLKDSKMNIIDEKGTVSGDGVDLVVFARHLLESGKNAEAATNAQKALEFFSDAEEKARCAYFAAEALILDNRPKEAMELLERINPYQSGNTYQTEAALILQHLQMTEPEKFAAVITLKKLEKAYQSSNLENVLKIGKELAEAKSPLSHYGSYYIAEYYFQNKKYPEAYKAFEQLIKDFPESHFVEYAETKVAQLKASFN